MSLQEYPYRKYPDFCQGAFYLLHLKNVEKIHHLFEMEFYKNFVWMEDVFLTGKKNEFDHIGDIDDFDDINDFDDFDDLDDFDDFDDLDG